MKRNSFCRVERMCRHRHIAHIGGRCRRARVLCRVCLRIGAGVVACDDSSRDDL